MFHCCDEKPSVAESRRRLAEQSQAVKTTVSAMAVQAKDRLVPLAIDAKDRLVPLALDAKDRLVPLAIDAKDRLVPLAIDARDRLVPLAENAVDRARPVVDSAIAKVADIVTTDIKPHLADLREQATPLIADASHRGHLAVAALAGGVPVVAVTPQAPAKKHRGHPILKALGFAALAAIIGLLIKALLDSRDDSWEADELFDDETDTDEEIILIDAEPLQTTLDAGDPDRYGDDCYIGDTPPAGFDIKANERSMKYHVPTAIGYQRCVTDIWFKSAEAAEAAGFTRALR